MEQPCYKCGLAVDEGVPFCPHCAAPQIRVIVAEPSPPPMVLAVDDTSPTSAGAQTVAVLALPMEWSQSLRPCALAALVASLLMYLGLYPIVAMLSVGFLAVVFYRQRRPRIRVRAMTGAGLGALSGLLWFAMSSILEVVLVIFLHKGPEIRAALLAKIQEAAAKTSDPQVLSMFERFKTPGGIEFLMIAGLVVAFLASIFLGGLGGALGGVVFGRRDRS